MRSWVLSLCLLLAGSSACLTAHIIPPPVPEFAKSRPQFSGIVLVLRDLRVAGTSRADATNAADTLRAPMLEYLRRNTLFADVVDRAPPPRTPPDAILFADVDVDVHISAYRTWILDLLFIYPGFGFLPVPTPQWGTATVKVTAAFHDGQFREIWTSEGTGKNEYSVWWYAWYRTKPFEKAYQEAFARAFSDFALTLGAHNQDVMAAMNNRPGRGTINVARRSLMDQVPDAPGQAPTAQELAPPPVDPNTPRVKIGVMLAGANKNADLPDVLDDYILDAVQKAGNFDAIGQDDISAMLGYEKQKDAMGCDDASCMASIGGALGVDLLVVVKVSKVAQSWAVSSKIINVKNPRVEARSNEIVAGDAMKLLQRVTPIINKLFWQRQKSPNS